MIINFLGQSCFLLRGKKTAVVTDPYSPEIGLKLSQLEAEVVTVSHDHDDHNYLEAVKSKSREEPLVIKGPGEYEIAGVSIFGVACYHDSSKGKERGKNTAYVITLDEVRLAHLGDLGHLLTDEQLEEINGVDILLVPVGGTYTLDDKMAVEVVGQIEPQIVIPMHYQLPGVKLNLDPVENFLKEMGVGGTQPVDKLVISRDKLPAEREVVVLNAKG